MATPRKRTPAKKTAVRSPRVTKTAPKPGTKSAPKTAVPRKAAGQRTRAAVKKVAKAPAKRAAKKTIQKELEQPGTEPVPVGDLVQQFMDEFLANVEASRHEGQTPSWGPVEAATRADLLSHALSNTALAQSAYVLARQVDAATSANEAATAGRELRFTVSAAIAYGRIRPRHLGDDPPADDSGTVVPESELDRLRREHEQHGRTGNR